MELASISATTETGFSDPKYSDVLPAPLAENGVTEETWSKFIAQANHSVKFDWNFASICCFFCNYHNKQVATKMENFCQDAKSLLPANMQVSYKTETEKTTVHTHDNYGAGKGGQLNTYHKLIFTKS